MTVLDHGWLPPAGVYFIDMELCDLTLDEYIYNERSNYSRTCIDASKKSNSAVFVGENSSMTVKLQNLWTIMTQIAQGLEFIHELHQVHGDLKPRNGVCRLNSCLTVVMFSSRRMLWKIGDFGTATEGNAEAVPSSKCHRGTACYRAPELIREVPHYTPKADIWGLGCILYELATRKKAFKGDWKVDEYAKTKQGPEVCVPTWPKDFQSHLSENVQELLAVDRHKRPYASVVRMTFNSYVRVLDPGIASPLMNNEESLPCYSQWKQLVQLPDQLDLGCRLTVECQKKGDEEAAIRVWKDLVERNSSKQSLGIPTHLSPYPVVNIITVSQQEACTETQEPLPDPPVQVANAPGQHQWSFDRLHKVAINEVRKQLVSSKTTRMASNKRSSRSLLSAAMLVPALVGTSVLSAPSTPTGERTPDPMFSVEARDTISSYKNNSENGNGRPASI